LRVKEGWPRISRIARRQERRKEGKKAKEQRSRKKGQGKKEGQIFAAGKNKDHKRKDKERRNGCACVCTHPFERCPTLHQHLPIAQKKIFPNLTV
jgi:hypothetical protein